MDPTFLNRNVNEGFSGGEKKRNEILQLAVLEVGAPQCHERELDAPAPQGLDPSCVQAPHVYSWQVYSWGHNVCSRGG
jgi:hypothetical protein